MNQKLIEEINIDLHSMEIIKDIADVFEDFKKVLYSGYLKPE